MLRNRSKTTQQQLQLSQTPHPELSPQARGLRKLFLNGSPAFIVVSSSDSPRPFHPILIALAHLRMPKVASTLMTQSTPRQPKNVLGEELMACGTEPVTGFYRDGCCKTGPGDTGLHTVCAEMNEEFLEFSRSRGNDLTTPIPEFAFPGLKPGDRWCLCAARWKEAYDAGMAPRVVLHATHISTLEFASLEELQKFAVDA